VVDDVAQEGDRWAEEQDLSKIAAVLDIVAKLGGDLAQMPRAQFVQVELEELGRGGVEYRSLDRLDFLYNVVERVSGHDVGVCGEIGVWIRRTQIKKERRCLSNVLQT
jgi:hypothetical protein